MLYVGFAVSVTSVLPNIGIQSNSTRFSVASHIYKKIYLTSSFATDLKAVLSSFSNVDTTAMGFPTGWRDEALWK
jgi:hypothetical protein